MTLEEYNTLLKYIPKGERFYLRNRFGVDIKIYLYDDYHQKHYVITEVDYDTRYRYSELEYNSKTIEYINNIILQKNI